MKSEERILTGAFALVETRGIGFSVDDLARHLGASKKTIYRYFSGKEEILERIMNSLFDDIHAEQKTISLDETLTGTEKFVAMLTLMPRRARALDYRLGAELRRLYPELHAKVERRLEEGWAPTLAVAETGIKSGEFRKIDLRVLKEILLSTMRSIMSDNFLAATDMTYAGAFGAVMDIILGGIRADGTEVTTSAPGSSP